MIHIPEHLERRSHLTYLVLLGLTALSAAACGDDAPNDDAPSKPYDPGDSDPNTDFEFDASLADAAVENDAGDDTDEVPSDASGNLSSEVYSSIGYGYAVVFGEDDQVVAYAVADSKCWVQPVPAEVWLTSKRDEQTLWFDYFGQKQPPMVFVRQPSLASVCPDGQVLTALDDAFEFNPAQELELFSSSFDEHYAFFNLRNVDWARQREVALDSLANVGGIEDYFELLSTMVTPLEDGHVMLVAGDDLVFSINERPNLDTMLAREYQELTRQSDSHDESPHDPGADGGLHMTGDAGLPSDAQSYVKREREKLQEIVLSFTEDGHLKTRANGALRWARLQGGYGYLALTRFSDFVDPPPTEFVHTDEHLSALNEQLDEALSELNGVSGLVLDVRDNEGGWDVAGRVVASRFAVNPVKVYEKRVRLGAGWTEPEVIEVKPSNGVRVNVPTVVLTGPGAVSAAETFVLAMREMPDVLTLGEATGGILSDALPKFLPSGIYFSLSNEEYRSVDGKVFERVGVPPDEELDVFSSSDRSSGRDSALERALELLGR